MFPLALSLSSSTLVGIHAFQQQQKKPANFGFPHHRSQYCVSRRTGLMGKCNSIIFVLEAKEEAKEVAITIVKSVAKMCGVFTWQAHQIGRLNEFHTRALLK